MTGEESATGVPRLNPGLVSDEHIGVGSVPTAIVGQPSAGGLRCAC